MSRHSVCETTPVQHALPLHGWPKTRRLRAVTVSLDRHCSLCQIYLLNHVNCGHCFRHIHFLPGTCTGTYTVWHARTCQRHPHVASVNNNIWHSAAATRIAKNTAPPCRDSVCFQTLFLTTYCPCEIAPDTSAWDVVRTCVSVCVCVSRHSVCETTTVHHALTAATRMDKTRRLRAVTVSFDRHASLCQNKWLNHGHCGHCFGHIHYLVTTRSSGAYAVWRARTWQGSIHTWRQWEKTLDLSLPPHASTKTRHLRAVTAFFVLTFLSTCWNCQCGNCPRHVRFT